MSFKLFNNLRILLVTGLLAVCSITTSATAQGLLPAELSDIGYIRISAEKVSVPVPNAEAWFQTGEMIPLVDATLSNYVALTDYEEGAGRICVFPRAQANGQGTAWVSEQNDLIFGTEAFSIPGKLAMRPTELLPILFETQVDYQVLCERHNWTFSLLVPKGLDGITFYEDLPAHIVQRVRQREMMKKKLLPPEPALEDAAEIAALRDEIMAKTQPPPVEATPEPVEVAALPNAEVPETTPEPPEQTVRKDPAEGLRKYTRTTEKIEVPTLSKVYKRRPKPKPAPAPAPVVEVVDPDAEDPSLIAFVDPPKVKKPKAIPAPVESKPKAVVETPEPKPEPIEVVKVQPPPAQVPATQPPEVQDATEPTPTPPAPVPVEVAKAPTPKPAPAPVTRSTNDISKNTEVLHTAILPSDRVEANTTPSNVDPADPGSAEPDTVNTVAQAALKLLVFLLMLTAAFFATIFLLARIVNRNTRVHRVASESPNTSTTAVPEFPAPEVVTPPPPQVVDEAEAGTRETPDQPVETPESSDIERPAPIRPVSDPSLGTFTGSLHGFSISELVQFLNSTQETGSLFISEPESTHNSCVVFDNGDIVHAVHETLTGTDAVGGILGLDDGFFVFQRQPGITCERTIEGSTMALLMNLSQNIDETRGIMPVESGALG